jgi:hypothetical protein
MDKFSRKLAWAVAVASFALTWPAVSGAQQNQGGEPWNQNQGNQNQQDRQQRDREREERERQQRDQSDRQRDQDQQRRDQQQDRQSRDNRGSEDAALGIALGHSDGQGARVSRVFRDSPAQQMGIRDGDRIVAVNGQQIESSEDLMREVENQNPGDEIRIEVERDGNREELTGRLESREEAFEHRGSQGQRSYSRRSWSEQGGYASSDQYGSSGRQQNVRAQLDRLERQVSQIQRELENLRFAIDEQGQQQRWSTDDRRDQSNDRSRESTARYEDDNSGRRMNQQTNYDRWDEQGGQRRSDRREIHRSSGGEVGEDRQEVGSSEINRDW